MKKINSRSFCLIKEKQKSTTHTIKDWRSFAFSKLKSLGKITQIEHIESQCFKDFTNLVVNLKKLNEKYNLESPVKIYRKNSPLKKISPF